LYPEVVDFGVVDERGQLVKEVVKELAGLSVLHSFGEGVLDFSHAFGFHFVDDTVGASAEVVGEDAGLQGEAHLSNLLVLVLKKLHYSVGFADPGDECAAMDYRHGAPPWKVGAII